VARIAITDQEVSRILADQKTVREDVKWQPKGHYHWVGCELPVENNLRVTLRLHLSANLVDRSKYSFSLVASRAYRIVSFDAGSSHINRHTNDQKWRSEHHKHLWTEICRDSYAYTPSDIDTRNLEQAFRSFCREISVSFQGSIEPLPSLQDKLKF
jgi:hypothetical protein